MIVELLGLLDITDEVPVALGAVARDPATPRRGTTEKSELHPTTIATVTISAVTISGVTVPAVQCRC